MHALYPISPCGLIVRRRSTTFFRGRSAGSSSCTSGMAILGGRWYCISAALIILTGIAWCTSTDPPAQDASTQRHGIPPFLLASFMMITAGAVRDPTSSSAPSPVLLLCSACVADRFLPPPPYNML